MGYGLIATPGAIDSHVHLISPELLPAALSGGVTTLITAGFEEPPWAMARTLAGLADWPLNVGLQACARAEQDASLDALLEAGACGFKIHEDYGAYPELIDHTLRYADAHDVSVSLHTDGLHESAELEDTVAAIDGRTVHAYHVEGSGGGHVPDVIGLVREPNVICSSTTPTVPWGVNAAAEQLPMIVLNHGASFAVAEDVELVRERVHPATMAAEGPLHELGAIAIVNSDSQGMGRMMETVRRTFQLAHVMASWSGTGPAADPYDANERVLRYLAKVTIEPAITHGIADHVGLAPAGPPRRHRPVAAGLLRREAGGRPQVGHRRLGAARRGQRHGRGRRADALSARLGRARSVGRIAVDDVRVVPGGGVSGAAAPRPRADRRQGDARPDARVPRQESGGRRHRGRRSRRHGDAWTAARSPSSRSARCRSAVATCSGRDRCV